MRRTIHTRGIRAKVIRAKILPLLIASLFYGSPASGLVDANVAEGAVRRYTVLVTSSLGRCSGVVLAQDVVLTAAHCVLAASTLKIAGDLGGGLYALSDVVEAVSHPLYRPSDMATPDLALLKLERPLPDRFIPATLGGRVAGDHLIVAGYGKASADDPYGGTVLRMELLGVSGASQVRLWFVSASRNASGGCNGDSGGPVFTYRGMYALVGVIVRGMCGRSTIAVNLAPYHGWINETILKLAPPRE